MSDATSDVSVEVMRTLVEAWRAAPDQPLACPACQAPGVAIVDRSARPHAEWYVVTCASCGFDQTLHIPLAVPPAHAP